MKLRIGGVIAPALSALCVTMVCSGQGADETAVLRTAKALVENHKDAVVEVRLVLKIKTSIDGRAGAEYESGLVMNGTVIEPSGLTVVSNFDTEFSRSFFDPGVRAVITGAKIVLADGREYAAKVVLRDKELDLAFVRPEEGGLHLPYIELKPPPAEPQLLDEVILLTRLERAADRAPTVSVVRLTGIIRQPRTQYVAVAHAKGWEGIDPSRAAGCPVFDGQGNALGISLVRVSKLCQTDSPAVFAHVFPAVSAVLPCKDILEVARQVPPAGKDKKDGAPPQ